MTLVRVKPIKEFDNLHNSFQKYFDDFASVKSTSNNPVFSPKFDISENNNQLKIEAEVPGVIKEDLKNRKIPFDLINENPLMKTRKPYYNILLDDRAGLKESFYNLKKLTNEIRDKKI